MNEEIFNFLTVITLTSLYKNWATNACLPKGLDITLTRLTCLLKYKNTCKYIFNINCLMFEWKFPNAQR